MSNFTDYLNDGKIGLMLLYGENGSYIPVEMLYLLTRFRTYITNDNYDDEIFFTSDDGNKTIIIDSNKCEKMFKKHVVINDFFSLDKAEFDIFKRYQNITLKNFIPNSLSDLNAYYKSGLKEMGMNYSLIPVVVNNEEFDFVEEDEEEIGLKKCDGFKIIKRLKKVKAKEKNNNYE